MKLVLIEIHFQVLHPRSEGRLVSTQGFIDFEHHPDTGAVEICGGRKVDNQGLSAFCDDIDKHLLNSSDVRYVDLAVYRRYAQQNIVVVDKLDAIIHGF